MIQSNQYNQYISYLHLYGLYHVVSPHRLKAAIKRCWTFQPNIGFGGSFGHVNRSIVFLKFFSIRGHTLVQQVFSIRGHTFFSAKGDTNCPRVN